MITLFNRKELTITYSMEQQSHIREILAANNIQYSMKTVNRNSPSPFGDTRARTGTFGQDMGIAYEYIIYVRRDDYGRATALINETHAN